MAAPSYVDGSVNTNAAALNLTMTIPAGATTDDYMIAFMKQSENTTQRTWDDDGGGGNGWTRIAYNRSTGGRDQETAVFVKKHSGSETNPTFTWATGITAEPMTGILLVYRDVDTVEPFTEITYMWATNDCNPPNPDVRIDSANTRVICYHAATHDDISSVGAPTGFTIRDYQYGGSAGHSADHRDAFTADIEVDTTGTYSPPDWTHGASNATPEYQTYSIALNEAQAIHVTGGTVLDGINWTDTNLTVTGDGFGATQSTGKLEIWSDQSGTIKTVQSIDSWSDTSIQFDATQGSLSNNTIIYVVVTNSSAEENAPKSTFVGLAPYNDTINETVKPDHYWRFNNSYDDTGVTGPARPFTSGVIGTWTFNTQEICDSNTHSLNLDSASARRETADSSNMNITIISSERTIAMWVQLNEIQHALGAIWKEGGGVQNLAFLVGYGNVLLFQGADTPGNAINAQAWSDFKLSTNRPYHICGRYTLTESPKELRLYIDGVEQSETDGNPLGAGNFDSHSGDNVLNNPDANLETGGTDISYTGMGNAQVSDFVTFSDNSTGTNAGALDKTTEIRDILYRRGALPDDIITTGTESAMQTALDATDDTRKDWALSYRIQSVTGAGDLELTMNDKVFNSRISDHLEWRGGDTLTIVNAFGSDLDSSKCWSVTGGTIVVINEVEVEFTVRNVNTKAIVVGARVLITADTGGDLPYQDTVTITRSSSTATVTHTAHGMRTGQEMFIKGAVQTEYNGKHTITVTSANAYTYTVSGTPTTPATGTIKATAIVINTITDANGKVTVYPRYSSDQPITGTVRQATTGTKYIPSVVTSTITSTGLSETVFLVPDE